MELFERFCIFVLNQTKFIMKKLNFKKNKLPKKALKNIIGGQRPEICVEGLCFMPGSDEPVAGLIDRHGNCC